MPEISRFYGMIVKMHFDDHLPPHFHAEYGEHEALININTLAIIAGRLPPKALGLIVECRVGFSTSRRITDLMGKSKGYGNITQNFPSEMKLFWR